MVNLKNKNYSTGKTQNDKQNIHGVEEHEARGDWEGGGLLWMDSKVGSWFTNTNHK